jgi:hypothetical protein
VDLLAKLAREIVVKRALVVGAVLVAVHLAVGRGWLHTTDAQAQVWTERVVDTIGALVAAGWIRGGVTPADPAKAPVSSDGKAFVVTPAPAATSGTLMLDLAGADVLARIVNAYNQPGTSTPPPSSG